MVWPVQGECHQETLDMLGSPYLTISWYKGDECWGPLSKSGAEMRALEVSNNTRCVGYV